MILKIYSILNTITSINNNINQLLYELLTNLYYILLFHELSKDIIDKEINKTQIDIILLIIQKIFDISEDNIKNNPQQNKYYYDKIIEFNEDIINLDYEFESNIQSHNVHQFIEDNKNVLSNTFLNNKLIKQQITKLSELVKQFNNFHKIK